ncbi:GNAT family N-acetyltransferase [Tateyamaria omphalii]|uniref:N-acetyltransferase domain-containing protein n=1 Tax=Tateyamaria omphalii TaxID=299262 RepID=A0A1P8MX65_9RHOB|nr:GNAT family N-acetyltransferase [Tateyamaria omphalii]APX12665.1 hypothetical protein BWR18_13960 [Tateyamaria omphalii]
MTFPCETPRTGAASLFAIALQGHLPTLATDRLILRAPRVTDFDTYAQIACTRRGQHLGGPMTREDAWLDFSQMTSTWLLHGHGLWTIGHAGDIAGFVVLGYEPGDQEPELGFMLTEKAEGMGIAREAAHAALTHAFQTLGWSTLVSYIDPANTRSIKLAQRLGGLPDGEITEDGETTLIYRYLREVM